MWLGFRQAGRRDEPEAPCCPRPRGPLEPTVALFRLGVYNSGVSRETQGALPAAPRFLPVGPAPAAPPACASPPHLVRMLAHRLRAQTALILTSLVAPAKTPSPSKVTR